MSKMKFEKEYEIKASPKMLFQYLQTPGGLQSWFADKVELADGIYNFNWDNEEHKARITIQRTNKKIRFEFDHEEGSDERPSYIEFTLDQNDFTNASYLKIIDYSDMNDEEELNALWNGLIQNLKEAIGG